MKGDFTRSTFKPGKHYSGVRMQQGRVQLDSDWNEEVDIIDHRWRATLEDVIGPNGVPKVGGGFAVSALYGPGAAADLALSPGRIYVDGILCEIDGDFLVGQVGVDNSHLTVPGAMIGETTLLAGDWIEISDPAGVQAPVQAFLDSINLPSSATTTTVGLVLSATIGAKVPAGLTTVWVRPLATYLTQPDLAAPPAIDLANLTGQTVGKTYVAYLDVWQNHLTALDDPAIREVALGGPDTGTRTRTTWQVRLLDVSSQGAQASCATAPFPAASTGRMQARAVPTSDPANDCLLPADAGYRRLENQLYRVEIHQPGDFTTATFKWSRDNGSVAFAWTGATTSGGQTKITIKGSPQDTAEGLASGQWLELTDENHELSPDQPGTLVQIGAPEGDTLPISQVVTYTDFPRRPKARRWDSNGTINVKDPGGSDGWIALEDGVEVKFQAGGQFNKGDYWLIPARTATTDIEWPNDPPGNPVARLADGLEHRYCALALMSVSAGKLTVSDCRPDFPALTAITADDVSYDNSKCKLVNASTVQEAIDALCQGQDLAHHNKLLHGYGIVCGLQLECDKPKGTNLVKLRAGTAIDCNGNDLEMADTDIDVNPLINSLNPPPADPANCDISLVLGLDQNGKVQVTAEAFQPPASEVDEIFGGTLLLDLYDDCVKPFQKFMQEELKKLPGDPNVSGGQELASAVINLAAQGPNPQAGQNVYISQKEHELLSGFYADLGGWLRSDTFCALFENARPYPTSDPDQAFGHIFGSGHHTGIRWRPNTRELFTIGNGTDPTRIEPRINRFDADKQQLLEQIDPTDGSGGTGPIQAFAFSRDGSQIFVALVAANGTDTLYRAGTVTPQGINWLAGFTTISGVLLTALESQVGGGLPLLAIGMINHGTATRPQLVGSGAYAFFGEALIGQPAVQLPVADAFNATGRLHLFENLAVAPFHSQPGIASPSYDSLRVLEAEVGKVRQIGPDISLPTPGVDGAVLTRGGQGLPQVYAVTGMGAGSKSIVGYTFQPGGNLSWVPITDQNNAPMQVAVDSCPIRLSVQATIDRSASLLLWASLDFYSIRAIDLNTHLAIPDWVLPTQVGPIDLAWDSVSNQLAVLNSPSDTVLLFPAHFLVNDPAVTSEMQQMMKAIVAYHAAAVTAYADLLAGFLQYLKDCFCHHLLVNCPDCTPAKKLYLGAVSIRSKSVYNICNFSGRHYLKTFPTMGYWLSLFPLVPLIGELVEKLCCMVIPELFASYKVPAYSAPGAGSTPRWSLQSLFHTMQHIEQLDIRNQLQALLQRVGLAKHVMGLAVGMRQLPQPVAVGPAGFVQGTAVASAQGALAQRGILTSTQPFMAAVGPQLLTNLVDIIRPPAGPSSPVVLNEAQGQVVFTSSPPAQPAVADLQRQLAAKDAQLQQVQNQVTAMTVQVQELQAFRQQVTQYMQAAPAAPGAPGTPGAPAAPGTPGSAPPTP